VGDMLENEEPFHRKNYNGPPKKNEITVTLNHTERGRWR